MPNPAKIGGEDDAEVLRMDAFQRLAGGIAHDFNNFLTSVLSTTDLALTSPGLAPEVRADLEAIRESSKRAAATVRQLLMFSRNQVVQPRPTDLNRVVTQMEPLLRRLLPSHVALELNCAARVLAAVDLAQIEQVLVALVRNAIDAIPTAGKVTIETSELEIQQATRNQGRAVLPGRYVVLRVRDTGIGMDEATRQRIFEPYFTTKPQGTQSGAGLGLAAVHGILEKAGSHIFVSSRPGEGSMFEVCIPRADPAAASPASATVEVVTGGGEVVLVLEHEAAVRAPVCRGLRQQGYYVLEAANVDQALHVLQEYHAPVHLVIVDISEPNVNAGELIGLLQSWYPSLKVLLVTDAQESGPTGTPDLPAGSARTLNKPFTAKRLALVVRSLLDDREPVAS